MRLSSSRSTAIIHRPQQDFPLWDKAGTRPSLDLQFADRKDLVDATTGSNLVDFTRASSGTYVGSDGLIKTATTNLLLRSEEFSQANWTNNSFELTVNSDQSLAPNGTNTADSLVPNSGVSLSPTGITSFIRQDLTKNAEATTYTLSIYAKSFGLDAFRLYVRDSASSSNSAFATYSLSSASIILAANSIGTFSNASESIKEVGNGWYHCTLTYTTSTETGNRVIIAPSSSTSITADGTSGIYLWGAQLEQSTTVGEYVKTTSTINSAPRFDHDPTTGESLGLLAEESRTNLIVNSENFSGTGWAGGGTATLDSTVADPTGVTGTVYYPSISERYNTFNADGASQIAVSCFVKQRSGETNDATVQIYQSVAGTVVFLGSITLPLTGTFTAGGNYSNGTRTEYPNGWYRFTFIANADAGQGTGTFTTAGRLDIEGSISTNYIWGVQIESASFPTSYIPTTSSTVTRSADVASISGSAFSGFYNQSEGTMFATSSHFRKFDGSNRFPRIFSVRNTAGSSADSIELGYAVISGDATIFVPTIRVGAAVQATFSLSGTSSKASSAIAYKLNNINAAAGGTLGNVDTSASIPSVSVALIGDTGGANENINGHISRITFWPTRFPDSTLQAITG